MSILTKWRAVSVVLRDDENDRRTQRVRPLPVFAHLPLHSTFLARVIGPAIYKSHSLKVLHGLGTRLLPPSDHGHDEGQWLNDTVQLLVFLFNPTNM